MADYLKVWGAQLTIGERKAIKHYTEQISAEKPNLVMVNIGIMWGGTMWCLRAGAPLGILYGVDIAPRKWKITDEMELNAIIIEGDSRVVHQDFDQPIDVLLIDGDHHYATVKADIEGWVPKCKGIVIFHDYSPTEHNINQFPELEGVKRAVDEWFTSRPGWVEQPAPDSLKVFRWQK